MKRYYGVQIGIDACIIILGLFVYLFPEVALQNANMVFYTLMGGYAFLELLEYLLGGESKESLYLFAISFVCSFSGFFLRNFKPSGVLSITLAVFILMFSITKIINLENIYNKKTRLFIIKLCALSFLILTGVLISINIYFELSKISYMLSLMYMSYGYLELICDLMDYLSFDVKFLKE